MMVTIDPGTSHIGRRTPYKLPPYLAPMLEATRGTELITERGPVSEHWGLKSFVYGMSLSKTHGRDKRFYVWGHC